MSEASSETTPTTSEQKAPEATPWARVDERVDIIEDKDSHEHGNEELEKAKEKTVRSAQDLFKVLKAHKLTEASNTETDNGRMDIESCSFPDGERVERMRGGENGSDMIVITLPSGENGGRVTIDVETNEVVLGNQAVETASGMEKVIEMLRLLRNEASHLGAGDKTALGRKDSKSQYELAV